MTPSRVSRALLFLLSSILILISGCNLAKPSLTPDEKRVYEVTIEILFLEEGIEQIVVLDRTSKVVPSGKDWESHRAYLKAEFSNSIAKDTLEDFYNNNRNIRSFDTNLSLNVSFYILTQEEQNQILDTDDGWRQFYQAFPESPGILTFSRVGFNIQANQALVYVGNQVDHLAGRGYYVLLSKEGGEWIVNELVVAWIS